MNSPVIHFEFISNDPEPLKRFYAETFGWELVGHPEEGFSFVYTGDPAKTSREGATGDIGPLTGTDGDLGLIIYVEVEDVDATLATVERLGGTVKTRPREIENGPRIARIADPDGNIVGVVKRGPAAPPSQAA